MSYGRIIGVVAVMVMGAAFVMGCGDDGEASSDVTKAEFTKEAEAVCEDRKKEWDAEVDAFFKESAAEVQKTGKNLNPKEARERFQEVFKASLLPLLQEEQEELEALDPPAADEEKVEEMLKDRAEVIETLEDKGLIALSNGQAFAPFEKEAKAYGLNCSMF